MNPEDEGRLWDLFYKRVRQELTEKSFVHIRLASEKRDWEQTREVSLYYDKLWLGELGIKG